MNDRTIISCAVTGSAPTPEKNPAVPVTPEEIANSAIDAAEAGAAIAHIHVRDPETGGRSIEFEHYREVVERIRGSGSDLIINLTTGPGAKFVPGEADPAVAGAGTLLMTAADRVRHVEELKPEICSLDMATMNFRDSVFLNAPDVLRDMARPGGQVDDQVGAAAADAFDDLPVVLEFDAAPAGLRVAHMDVGEADPAVAGAGTLLMTAADRVRHVEELKPEICSLDMATMNFRDSVFLNAPDVLRDMARRITQAGVKAEIEVFDTGHIELARQLIDEGVLPEPAYFQLCLGISYGAAASPEAMMFMRDRLPEGSQWSAFGISRSQFPMVGQAVLLGGHARVGLEDNIYLGPGELAPSNAALVERARQIIESLGGAVATPTEARAILGLG